MHKLLPRNQARIAGGVLLIAWTLGSCATAQSNPQPSPPPTLLPTIPPPTPTATAYPILITLSLWVPEELDPYSEQPGAEALAQQLAEFRRVYPLLQVEITVKRAHGEGGLVRFLNTARDAAPSVLPDLVIVDAEDLETLAGANLIHPLDAFLTADADPFPFAAELGQVDGRTYGIVIGAKIEHLVYRPALISSPPISWTQVLSISTPFLFPAGSNTGQVNDATLIQYLAAGGELTDSEGRPRLDKEALASVLGFYRDCVTVGIVSPSTALNITDPDQAWGQFLAGAGGLAVTPSTRYWLDADESIAAAPIPTRDGRPLTIARGWALALVTDDPLRQQAAMQLFDWLVAPERNAQWTQSAGYLPGTRSAFRLWRISDAERTVWRSLMESAIPPPRAEVMATTGVAMQEAVEAVLTNQASPEEAAAQAVERLGP